MNASTSPVKNQSNIGMDASPNIVTTQFLNPATNAAQWSNVGIGANPNRVKRNRTSAKR